MQCELIDAERKAREKKQLCLFKTKRRRHVFCSQSIFIVLEMLQRSLFVFLLGWQQFVVHNLVVDNFVRPTVAVCNNVERGIILPICLLVK